MKSTQISAALSMFALLNLSITSAYAYGTTTHRQISCYSYRDARNIQANFFTALGLPASTPFRIPACPVPQYCSGIYPSTNSAQDWLMNGSEEEDNDLLPYISGDSSSVHTLANARVLYHFFDPLGPSPAGLQFEGGRAHCKALMSSSPDWATYGIGNGYLTLFGNVTSDTPWLWGGPEASVGALNYYLQGLTAASEEDRATAFGELFLSLGHIIHLLQDAAQPQHVRNDAHLNPSSGVGGFLLKLLCGSNPSSYENFVDVNFENNPQWFTGDQPPTGSEFASPTAFFNAITQFTNSNFVSRGTNCSVTPTITCSNNAPCPCSSHTSVTSWYSLTYPLPTFSGPSTSTLFVDLAPYNGDVAQCQMEWTKNGDTHPGFSPGDAADLCTKGTITFFQNTVKDSYGKSSIQNPRMTSASIFDLDLKEKDMAPLFTLNTYNYQAQADILLPMAEGYSAGILNYFFRGSITASGNSNGFTITNNSMNGDIPQSMSGEFSLYLDQSGIRTLVSGPWSISIPGGASASTDDYGDTLTVDPPISTGGQAPTVYTLVFQGSLGPDLLGGVAGASVTIPYVVPTQ